MILKVGKILANVVPNYPFAQKQNFFWKTDEHHFCLPVEPHHHPTAFETNP